jgi:hypothetical protein
MQGIGIHGKLTNLMSEPRLEILPIWIPLISDEVASLQRKSV